MGQSVLLKRLTFYSEHIYSKPRPEVPLTLHAPGGDCPVLFAVLDTGAVPSVFQVSVAGLLGIDDVTTGRLSPLELPDGSHPDAWVFPAEATILGHRIHFDMTFCPSFAPTMPNVLGMRDVFDKIVFGFEHANRTVYA
jgi:hypothetical protein